LLTLTFPLHETQPSAKARAKSKDRGFMISPRELQVTFSGSEDLTSTEFSRRQFADVRLNSRKVTLTSSKISCEYAGVRWACQQELIRTRGSGSREVVGM
jgi:hypothetical protein